MYKSNRKKIHKYAEKKRLLTLVSIYLVLKTFLSQEKISTVCNREYTYADDRYSQCIVVCTYVLYFYLLWQLLTLL